MTDFEIKERMHILKKVSIFNSKKRPYTLQKEIGPFKTLFIYYFSLEKVRDRILHIF